MKTAIVYVSYHHGNTKKLAEAIKKEKDVTLIDGMAEKTPDLSGYDVIGFAAGIAYGRLYAQMLELMERSLPEGKRVFLLYTCGTKKRGYTNAAAKIAAEKKCTVLGEYGCLGFDTCGPFKLIGGIAKGHPDDGELLQAVRFFDGVIQKSQT